MRRAFLLLFSGAALACAGAPSGPTKPRPEAKASVTTTPPPNADGARAWTYEVAASPGGAELSIAATFAPGSSAEMSVADDAEPFVHDVAIANGSEWKPLAATGSSWLAPECRDHGCRLRYGFSLRDAAVALGDVSSARRHGPAIEAPPSTWLLRPIEPAPKTTLRFHVTVAPGDAFVTGVFPVPGTSDTYEAPATKEFQLAYAAFGLWRVSTVENGRVRIAISPGAFEAGDETITAWVATSARAVTHYYGQPPVPHLLVMVNPGNRDGVGFGTTMGGGGAAISIAVGRGVDAKQLREDWVLVHEMVHTAVPDMLGPQHWLEEGLATYVEPLVRSRAGLVSAEELWTDWMRNMPKGNPQAGDRGLDNTPTWGRTYWGGALFCLVADVGIRERTHNAKSLDDALREILHSGGSIAASWDMARVTSVGDGATQVPVLGELYAKMASSPSPVDLPALWKRLGVSLVGGRVSFDDRAPLADVRRAMTSTPLRESAQRGMSTGFPQTGGLELGSKAPRGRGP